MLPVDSFDRILTLCVENGLAKTANRGETSWKTKKVLARNGKDRMKAVPVERTSVRYICEIRCMGLGS